MKKIYCITFFSIFLLSGCSSTDYQKIRIEENDKFFYKEHETAEIIKEMGEKISLEEALSLGERRNSSIKIRELQSEISKLDKNIAFGNFLPKITVGGSYNQLNGGIYGQPVGMELPFPIELETRIVDKNFYVAGVGATLPIFTPTAWYLYEARKKGVDISRELEEYERKKVRVQIINSYYHIAVLESERDYLKKEIEHGRELVKNSSVALEVESIMPWEYEQSQQFLKSREFALGKNLREISEAKMQFLKLLNLHPLVNFEIEKKEKFSEKILELDTVIYSALENSSLLKIEDISHGIKEDMKKIAVANFLPNIALTGGYSRINNSAMVDPIIMNGSIMGALSIFNGFQNINNYKKSKKNLEISEIAREDSAVKVVLETVNAFNFYEEVRDNLELAEINYSILSQKFHQKKIEREVGLITDEEYLKIYGERERAFSLLKNCEYRYEIALAILELITGGYDEKR